MAGLLHLIQTSSQQHLTSPAQRKALAPRGATLLAPEVPDTSHRACAAPKGSVLTEQGGGTSSGNTWSGSTCPEQRVAKAISCSGCSPSRSAGVAPLCSPKTAWQKHPRTSPRRAKQQSSWGQARANQPCHSHTTATPRAGRAHGFLLPLDSSCACSSTPVTLSLTSSVATLPKVTFCIVLLSPSPGIVPCQSRPGGLCPPASWGRGETEPQQQQPGAQGPLQPCLYGFQPCCCPCQQDKTGSKR